MTITGQKRKKNGYCFALRDAHIDNWNKVKQQNQKQ